jgi:L-rhamnose mutarotase
MELYTFKDDRFPSGKYVIYHYAVTALYVTDRSIPAELQQEIIEKHCKAVEEINAPLYQTALTVPTTNKWIFADEIKEECDLCLSNYAGDVAVHYSSFPKGVSKIMYNCKNGYFVHLFNLGKEIPEELLQIEENANVVYVVFENCDSESLLKVLDVLHPMAVLSVYPEAEQDVIQIVSKKWPVVELTADGVSFKSIYYPNNRDSDFTDIVAIDFTAARNRVIKNQNSEQWWKIKKITLGRFWGGTDATPILSRVVYNPQELVGFHLSECGILYKGDIIQSAFDCSYLPDGKQFARFNLPYDDEDEDIIPFLPDEKVWVWMDSGLNALIPCEFIGIATEEMKENYFIKNASTCAQYPSFHLFTNNIHGDFVAVRPLVFIEGAGSRVMQEIEVVPPTYIFPYREFVERKIEAVTTVQIRD